MALPGAILLKTILAYYEYKSPFFGDMVSNVIAEKIVITFITLINCCEIIKMETFVKQRIDGYFFSSLIDKPLENTSVFSQFFIGIPYMLVNGDILMIMVIGSAIIGTEFLIRPTIKTVSTVEAFF